MRNIFLIILAALGLYGCSVGNNKDVVVKSQTITKDTVCYLTNASNAPSLKLHISVDVPSEMSDKDLLKSVQTIILKTINGSDCVSDNPENAVHDYLVKCASEYASKQQEYNSIKDSTSDSYLFPESFNWNVDINGKVTYSDDKRLTYLVENTRLIGDKKVTSKRAVNISLADASIIKVEDLFNEDYQSTVLPLIVSQLKSDNNVSNDDDLESVGFFDKDEIFVSPNFQLDKDGIIYIYNPGEIAPNVIGNVDVKISYSALSAAIKEKSSIQDLVK